MMIGGGMEKYVFPGVRVTVCYAYSTIFSCLKKKICAHVERLSHPHVLIIRFYIMNVCRNWQMKFVWDLKSSS